MKGIILAGGSGTRLYPITHAISKQMLPVYDKPMIYYPLSTLILGGIKDILIITTPDDAPMFKKLLGDGKHIGLNLQYAEQPKPEGLAQAFIIGESFINNDQVSLVLGDNLFYGYLDFFKRAMQNTKVGATIFGYVVQDPERYGVVEFDAQDRVISLEEKPKHPKSHYAVPGLYVYDNQVVQIAKSLKPSPRGELEITDLNRVYLELGQLMVQKIGRGVAWLDTGTPQALLEANNFIGAVEQRQGMMIGCIEEAALRAGFLTIEQYQKMLEQIPKSPYRQYLERIAIEP